MQTLSGQATRKIDFKDLIQCDFLQRLSKNPNYSLRAYSRALGVNQSFLSKILNGKRNASKNTQRRLLLRLGHRLETLETESRMQPLAGDAFLVIKDWYHFAILELLKIRNFKPSTARLAAALGLHTEEVRAALERLERNGFISCKANTIRLLRPHNSFANTIETTEAKRSLQKTLGEKSLAALEYISFEERDHSSLTIAIDRKRLPEIKKKLQELRRELGDFMQGSGELNDVYQLTIGLFPLTNLTNKKGARYEK